MSLGARRTLVAGILTVVVLAVIGLLYLQVAAQNNATRNAWLVTQPIPAGSPFSTSNVTQIRIHSGGDQFAVLQPSPISKLASRSLAAQTLLRSDDLVAQQTALVPINLRSPPPLNKGDLIDVFATGTDGRTTEVGRQLVVASTANPTVVEVSAATEQAWIT
ncbi:MAG: hypothetical protein ACREN8_12780, partial [Candidatus Dormibacteraceae bacterium]